MKYLSLGLVMAFTSHVHAMVECAGFTSDKSYVLVRINTVTAAGVADEGAVIIERQGNKHEYRFAADEISQFYEYDDRAGEQTIVGLNAYVRKEFPVSAKYVGLNYADQELRAVLSDKSLVVGKGNFLRVWKGPGYAATDQHSLNRIVCSVWSNI